MRISHLLFLLFFALLSILIGCQTSENHCPTVSFRSVISDSFYVAHNSKNGSERFHFFNDSTGYTFDHLSNTLQLFSKDDNILKPSIKISLSPIIPMWFSNFIDFNDSIISFFDRNNAIWKHSLKQNKTELFATLVLDTEILHDYSASQPFIYLNDTLVSHQSYKDYPTSTTSLLKYAKDAPLLQICLDLVNKDSITTTPLGQKPKGFLSYFEPYPRFTYNSIKRVVVMCYVPTDTLYQIFFNGTQVAKAISNKHYSASKGNSQKDFFEPKTREQVISYYSNNFRYTGIRYNETQNHYLLTFTTPKESIKEWINTPMKGLVLDDNLNTLYYLEFELDKKPFKSGDFVQYGNKVAIRTNNIESNKTNYEKYYILNF